MPLALRERLLHGGERRGLLVEAHAHVRLGHDEVEEREVIAEGEDALRLGDRRVRRRTPARKSDSAIGVTYSCEKRTSVRAKSASPGFTARRRRACPARASTMACAARIFSQSVIGRGGVVIAGGETLPARRALL